MMADKSKAVKTVRRTLLLGTLVLAGCHTAHDVAVTSFRVIDAPANYVRRRIDGSSGPETTTTTTTTAAGASDSVTRVEQCKSLRTIGNRNLGRLPPRLSQVRVLG